MTPRFLSLGDRAFTVEFAPEIDAQARAAVAQLDSAVACARNASDLKAVIDVVPTFRSLTVHYDPMIAGRTDLEAAIRDLVGSAETQAAPEPARWRFPVLYGGEGGPDLLRLAETADISVARAIELHAATEVEVYMLGFQPGFAFMGDIADALRRPRLSKPRTRVPAGSVAVADRLTAVYPWESPGGWHLIGRCPVRFFDPGQERPSLLSPSDRVRFEPVEASHFTELEVALRAGEMALDSFRSAA